MTIDPDKFWKYYENMHRDLPDTCFREWPCPAGLPTGEVCFKEMPYKSVVEQLDEKTKSRLKINSLFDCPQSYIDLVNRCLYGRISEREGCPKNMINPYKNSKQ